VVHFLFESEFSWPWALKNTLWPMKSEVRPRQECRREPAGNPALRIYQPCFTRLRLDPLHFEPRLAEHPGQSCNLGNSSAGAAIEIENEPHHIRQSQQNGTFQMKAGFIKAALAAVALCSAMTGTANAAGCLKGAVVGGVAGHYAGHHAVVGAVGGCLVGRHVAKKHAEELASQRQQAKMQ
jgi:hypothetical protein